MNPKHTYVVPSILEDSFDVHYDPKRGLILEWENDHCIQRVLLTLTEATIVMAETAKVHQNIIQEVE